MRTDFGHRLAAWRRSGMGDLGDSVCFDVAGNAVDCGSPDAVQTIQLTPGQVAASQAATGPVPMLPGGDPSLYDIMYGGGQVSPGVNAPGYLHQAEVQASSPAVSVLQPGLPPGPSPRVSMPLSFNTAGMWLGNSTLVKGWPNWGVILGTVIGVSVIGGLISKRRRR
jgi:hypothetical protein